MNIKTSLGKKILIGLFGLIFLIVIYIYCALYFPFTKTPELLEGIPYQELSNSILLERLEKTYPPIISETELIRDLKREGFKIRERRATFKKNKGKGLPCMESSSIMWEMTSDNKINFTHAAYDVRCL